MPRKFIPRAMAALSALLRGRGRSPTAPELPRIDVAGPDQAIFMSLVDAVILERLGDDAVTSEQLARLVHVSRATLYRRVRESGGGTPMGRLWEARLVRAASLLRETDLPVSDVAYSVAFKSVPHFGTRFRVRFGMSPVLYRRQLSIETPTTVP